MIWTVAEVFTFSELLHPTVMTHNYGSTQNFTDRSSDIVVDTKERNTYIQRKKSSNSEFLLLCFFSGVTCTNHKRSPSVKKQIYICYHILTD